VAAEVGSSPARDGEQGSRSGSLGGPLDWRFCVAVHVLCAITFRGDILFQCCLRSREKLEPRMQCSEWGDPSPAAAATATSVEGKNQARAGGSPQLILHLGQQPSMCPPICPFACLFVHLSASTCNTDSAAQAMWGASDLALSWVEAPLISK
jgi:hypothetical protein